MEELDRKDCCRLAALHCESIPDSTVTDLGQSYAESFYGYVSRSKEEGVLVLREAGEIFSGCVLTLNPKTLRRRLLLHTPLLWYAIPYMCRQFLAKKAPKQVDLESDLPLAPLPDLPELILLFTAPGSRTKGAGAALVRLADKFVANHGFAEYIVKTVDAPSNRALRFYAKNGFTPVSQLREQSRTFRVFKKAVARV